MRANSTHRQLFRWVQDHIQTWIGTNDINSPTHYNDLHDFIEADLEDCTDAFRERLEEIMLELFNIIRKEGKEI